MSFFIEKYSTSLGVKPRKPHITEHFYPIEYDKYITIDPSQEIQSNAYKNWNFILKQIKSFTSDYKFVQVGLDKKYTLDEANKKTSNVTTLKNNFYILKNSSLHIGVDCICSHISSLYKVPTVCIYSKYPSAHTKPIYSDSSKFIAIDPDRGENLATYSDLDPNDYVNKIPPEQIISSCLDLLGISHNYDKYKTINIGRLFPSTVIEVVPDFKPKENETFSKIVNLRFDYTKERKYSEDWLKHKCNLLINSPIDISLINKYKDNIKGFTVFIDESNFSESYLNLIKTLGIPIRLTCKEKDKISDIRLKYFDWNITEYEINSKKDLDFSEDICDNTYYYSNKVLMSKGEKYSSKASWEHGIEYKEGEYESIIDSNSFWEEFEHFNIYIYA